MTQKSEVLSEVLDRLDETAAGDTVSLSQVVERLGHHSFAALMLIFALISTSPASAVPGVTAAVAFVELLLAVQFILNRQSVWLPASLASKKIPGKSLRKAVQWLRRPVRAVEKLLRPRLSFMIHRPWLILPLSLVIMLTMFMPFMEVIPTSGSIASAIIALFAAGVLLRDGLLVLITTPLLAAVPMIALYWSIAN
jgi:hypothetical protein